MNHTLARRSTWVVIALVLLIGGGAYFWFRTGAAVTVGSDAPSFQADLKNTLNLQAGVGSPTFTRATVATVTDFEGLIKTAKSGEARFEGARRVENLVTYSQNFSNAAWTKQRVLVTPNAIVSPDGSLTASKVYESAENGAHYINYSSSVPTIVGSTYVQSCYFKAGERTVIRFYGKNGANDVYAEVNITTGVITFNSFPADSVTVQSVGNGWWRVSYKYDATASTLT